MVSGGGGGVELADRNDGEIERGTVPNQMNLKMYSNPKDEFRWFKSKLYISSFDHAK